MPVSWRARATWRTQDLVKQVKRTVAATSESSQLPLSGSSPGCSEARQTTMQSCSWHILEDGKKTTRQVPDAAGYRGPWTQTVCLLHCWILVAHSPGTACGIFSIGTALCFGISEVGVQGKVTRSPSSICRPSSDLPLQVSAVGVDTSKISLHFLQIASYLRAAGRVRKHLKGTEKDPAEWSSEHELLCKHWEEFKATKKVSWPGESKILRWRRWFLSFGCFDCLLLLSLFFISIFRVRKATVLSLIIALLLLC